MGDNLNRKRHLDGLCTSETINKRLCMQQSSSSSSSSSSSTASPEELLKASNALSYLQTFLQKNNVSSLPPEFQNINFLPPEPQNTVQNNTSVSLFAKERERNVPAPSTSVITNTFVDLIHPILLNFLKSHQKDANKYLFDRVIGRNGMITIKRSGAMLAHNMGLGKSLTIIAFLHTVLSDEKMNKVVSKVLLVCPKNIISQWESEFKFWIDSPGRRLSDNINITCIDSKNTRFYDIKSWYETKDKKQILIMGYELYATLVKEGGDYIKFLQNPGPDLVVFDEAHRLKNVATQGYQMAEKMRTARTILLTGTPLQNNLMEFYNGLHLISPRLFKSKAIFKSSFIVPIENGRSKDASPEEVKTMQVRCKLLYKRTKDIVHRRGVQVLIDEIGVSKIEATFLVRPSKIQKELVEAYIHRIDPETGEPPKKNPVKDHPAISRILTHPSLFYEYATKNQNDNNEWMKVVSFEHVEKNAENLMWSNKLMLLIKIIGYCEKVKDKILVFSQSLQSLNFIEKILKHLSPGWKKQNENKWGWQKNIDYLRIDGKIDSSSRHNFQTIFNNASNPQCRLMLISTKAGSLGTNMVGANRVVIFDACFNPTHDIQSLYRVYRLGQTKPVYIYRLVTSGTMEEIVYNRQIAKEATCHRVIDEENIDRHFTVDELDHLYRFKYVPEHQTPLIKGNFKDPLISRMVEKYKDGIVEVVSHNSFFDEFNEQEVSESDVAKCEAEYEKEIKIKKLKYILESSDSELDDGEGAGEGNGVDEDEGDGDDASEDDSDS